MLLIALLACKDLEGDEPGECDNNIDEDKDWLFDCNDPDCAGQPPCGEPEDTGDSDPGPIEDTGPFDEDGDGWLAAEDCDDSDPAVHPEASDDLVDGVDQDCDGLDGPDADGDGYADAAAGGDDCDDSSDAIHPGADDLTVDGVDQNCDGTDGPDGDGDGYVDIERGGTDCDDANADAYPGAAFMDSTTECMLDADGDGWGDDSATGYTTPGSDCDDSDAAVHPGQLDWADGEDDNCDGLVDENGDLDDAAWALFYGRSGERMGKVLASVPDRDGDGLPELLIGSDEPKNSAGRFYVVEGLGAGVQALENVGLSLTGDSGSYDHMVEAVGTGDFDDDGLGDVLTGSRYWDLGSGNDNTGRAVILWGTDSGHLLAEDLSVGWVGSGNNQELGETLAGLGDWDGDGIDDFAVGEQGVGTPTAHLLLGGSLSSGTIDDAAELSVGTTGHDGWPGLELVQCQDLDGDGLSDWVISWYYDNTVWVIDSGLSGSMDLDDAAGVTWTGESGSGYFGYAVAAIGDYDGDGLSDLAISEYRKGSGYFGGFWVVPGGTTTSDKVTEVAILEVEGVEPWEFDGRSIGGGDITGDGHSEVFSGSVYMSRVSIYEGNQTGTLSTSDADVVFESGEDESDTFLGEDVVYLGDISGDGVGDLALSAWQTTYPPQSSEDEGFAPTGTVWVLLGGLR